MNASILYVLFLIILCNQNILINCGVKEKLDVNGMRDIVKPMSESCKRKIGVSDELVQGTHNGEFPRERSLMCYFKCISVMLKIMNKEGEVSAKNVESKINLLANEDLAPRLKKVAKICYKKVKRNNDTCEYAFEFAICSYKEDKMVNKNDINSFNIL